MNRQRVVLALLQQAGRPLPPMVFVKLIFLLRQETSLRRDRAFYEFVPYKYGPFSFMLYQELGNLRRNGYLCPDDGDVALSRGMLDSVSEETGALPEPAFGAIRTILRRYGQMRPRALVRNVYARYPWYASRSELSKYPRYCVKRRSPAKAAYTIGYQGRSVDGFFNKLLELGIELIIDVRYTPVSRKYGFSRRSLREIGAKLGIQYRHLPSFGVPAEHRAGLGSQASYERLLDLYELEILPGKREGIVELGQLMRRKLAVLLCMERNAERCHRSRLAAAVSRCSGLEVVHL